jgi:hypothetical protein
MVTRSRAFDAASIGALYYQRLWEAPIAPGRRATGLPASWEAAILRCLANDPNGRFASAGDVVLALQEDSAPAEAKIPHAAARRPWMRRPALLLTPVLLVAAAFGLRRLASRPPWWCSRLTTW